ncbi:hypothetical protein BCF74_12260 [Knoellia remsis]|uniref:Lipoprotein n=1 Tax=Knoellia remsis TaxID=407159 RepID=A0A2T0UCK7_9MICO|nr:hypothetical protein [Knoellia remsis]PRY55676.1 hypothetical protein BCF74_12260 [Knoellia remsis]
MRTFPSGPVRSTSRYAVPLAFAVGLLSACGSGDPATPSSSLTTEASTDSVAPTASGTPTAGPSMPGSGRARPMTMTGRVVSLEGGCTVFKDDRTATQYILVGETKGLSAGTAYTVEGVTIDTPDANCPQALPFQVRKATMTEYPEDLTPVPSGGPAAVPVTLRGTVAAGVEDGCRVLTSDQGVFVLVGKVSVPDGQVEVTGVRRDDVATTCQQGPAFEVTSARKTR